jgi:hypothetical protein
MPENVGDGEVPEMSETPEMPKMAEDAGDTESALILNLFFDLPK